MYNMFSQQEGGETAVNREDRELSPQEETAGSKETQRSPVVDDLLHISEGNFGEELEPYEYPGYSGWEDAVSESPHC